MSRAHGPKVGFFGPMKDLASAKQSVERLPTGQLRACIEHQPMPGVTPQMLRWWFEHIDEFTHYNGRDFTGPLVPNYRLWHPYDHIRVSWAKRVHDGEGRLTVGSIIAIEENLGGVLPVRAKARITKFDDEAFDFELSAGPVATGHLLHRYAVTDAGCSFYTEMLLGWDTPILRQILNPIVSRVFGGLPFLQVWVLHNIEESGETEKFVPQLYAHAMSGGVSDPIS
jgi:hypothetical protein